MPGPTLREAMQTPLYIDRAQVEQAPEQAWQSVHGVVDHPLYNVAQMAPGLNIPANALAYASHMKRGMQGEAMWDSAGVIPGVKGVGVAERALPRLVEAGADWANTAYNLAKNYPTGLRRAVSVGDPRAAVRMTGRQVGNFMQGKQAADGVISPVQAMTEY